MLHSQAKIRWKSKGVRIMEVSAKKTKNRTWMSFKFMFKPEGESYSFYLRDMLLYNVWRNVRLPCDVLRLSPAGISKQHQYISEQKTRMPEYYMIVHTEQQHSAPKGEAIFDYKNDVTSALGMGKIYNHVSVSHSY